MTALYARLKSPRSPRAMALLEIRHLTAYRYRRPVAFGEHRLLVRPMESFDQQVVDFDLTITPTPSAVRFKHDVFGNAPITASFDHRSIDLRIEARALVRHAPHAPFADSDDDDVAALPLAYAAEETQDLSRFIERHRPDPDGAVESWARRFLRPRAGNGARRILTEMTHAFGAEFRYAKRLVGEAMDPAETLRSREGSCRDYALLMMEAARSLGFAAQFVTGYLHAPERARGSLRRVGGGHTHAWLRLYLPKCGWVDFDPTNGLIGGQDLIRVAVCRDPRQSAPLAGVFFGEAEDYLGMEVEVEVSESPDALTALQTRPDGPPRKLRALAS